MVRRIRLLGLVLVLLLAVAVLAAVAPPRATASPTVPTGGAPWGYAR